MNPQPNKKRKMIRNIIIIAVVVIGYGIIAIKFGSHSEYAINQTIEQLQKDSIALQADFRPQGTYTHFRDVDKAVDELRALGNPTLYIDSAKVYRTPRTTALAKYNIAKCDSVLQQVLPLWRMQFIIALNYQLELNSETVVTTTVARISKEYSDCKGIEMYSTRYTLKSEIRNDYIKYSSMMRNLGFTHVSFAFSPESNSIEYDL